MAPSARTTVPLGDGPRRPWARSRRLSALVVVATVLALGGAVAAVITTGVTLGARIAPSGDAGARRSGPAGAGAAPAEDAASRPGSSSSSTTEDAASALPDRADGGTRPGTEPAAGTAPGTTAGAAEPGAGPVEPYPGVWPYAGWDEVSAHVARDDDRYRTAADTALRFASEVVGLSGATVGAVAERGVVGTVEIRSGQGSTLVRLTHATAGWPSEATPWSVVDATGTAALDAPTSLSGASLRVRTDATPGVVGVHDRRAWRGIGVAPAPGGGLDVRVDPGRAGAAMAIGVAGDPRRPSSFTMRRVQLAPGAGAAAPAAPADPLAATRALVDSLARGDVGATWELLDAEARRSVLDWRGLAGRVPALREQLAGFASGSFTTTSVTTPVGTVAVVAPAVAADRAASGPLGALAFRVDGGARLASTTAGDVSWTGPTATDASVLAAGASRPLVLVVDGAVWSSSPEGGTGLRASTATLAAGPHLALAVSVEGGQVTASAYRFEVADGPATPDGPPTTDEAPTDAGPAADEAPTDAGPAADEGRAGEAVDEVPLATTEPAGP